MLKKDPAQRISIKEIMEHPWMKQNIEQTVKNTSIKINAFNRGSNKAKFNLVVLSKILESKG